jgi:hypothetical protein
MLNVPLASRGIWQVEVVANWQVQDAMKTDG